MLSNLHRTNFISVFVITGEDAFGRESRCWWDQRRGVESNPHAVAEANQGEIASKKWPRYPEQSDKQSGPTYKYKTQMENRKGFVILINSRKESANVRLSKTGAIASDVKS